MTGVWKLVRLHLRTSWWGLLAWPVALSMLVGSVGYGVWGLYGKETDRMIYAATLGSVPVSQAFNGRFHDLTEVGGILSAEVGMFALVLIPVAGITMAVSRSRAQEDLGRYDLLTAGSVGPLARLVATAVVVSVSFVVFWVGAWASLAWIGFPRDDAALYCAVLALLGIAYAALGLLSAELASDRRGALALALSVWVITFLVRAIIDGQGTDAAWASPLGWAAEVRPWGQWRWWPVAAYVLFAVATLAVAAAIALRRDLGSGLLTIRQGRLGASPGLLFPAGWAWRITRGAWLGNLVGVVLWAGCVGVLAEDMADTIASNPVMAEALGMDANRLPLTMGSIVVAVTAAMYATGGRITAEERAGRLAILGKPGRGRTWLAWWGVLAFQALTILAAGALALGLASAASVDDWALLDDALRAAGAHAAMVVAVLGSAAAMRAFVPGVAPVATVYALWCGIVGLLGETLRLKEWAFDTSLLHLVGDVPVEPMNHAGVLAMVLAGLALVFLSGGLVRRRDLVAG